ncbi:helix-turn-helix domain-containing protein [Amycolatopsis antarctica]|nr:helix-turn-helix transcriptional regulator [Amycolatopsis antarctica]
MSSKPPLRRRRLARTLQKLREQNTELTVTDAARAAGFSQAKLSRIEGAHIAISGDDTDALCTVLGVPRELSDELVQLARQAKQRGWWQTYPDSILGRSTDLLELEADAVTEYSFTIDVVPGLLQTASYARTILRAALPREPDEQLQERLDLRMNRQKRIQTGELELWAIIDEPALRRAGFGEQVMAEQVERLAELAGTQQVSVQVIPDGVVHSALSTPYSLFTLDDGYKCVACDNLTGGLYIDDENEVQSYSDTWAKLAARALPFDESAERLSAIAEEHRRRTREPGPRPL